MCENLGIENLHPVYDPIVTLVTAEKNQILSVNYNCTMLSCVLLKCVGVSHDVMCHCAFYFIYIYIYIYIYKGEVFPLQARCGPEGG